MNTLGGKGRRILAGVLLLAGAAHAEIMEEAHELDLKLAFLLNFPKFIEWPEADFPDKDHSFTVCVIGNPRLVEFAISLPPRTLKEREISVAPAPLRGGKLDGCHMLYLDSTQGETLKPILAELGDRPVLTVGDGEEFAARGGMLGLLKENGRLRFEINLQAAARAGLKFSSKLIHLAVKLY